MSGRTKRNIVTAAVIGLLIVFVTILGQQGTKPRVVGDSISRTFTQGEPCVTTALALTTPGDADPATTAEALFTALEPLKGLNTATYNIKTASIDVGYCESSTTEDAVRAALAPTGLLAAADSSPTPPAE